MTPSSPTPGHVRFISAPWSDQAAAGSLAGPMDWVWETDSNLALAWVSSGVGGLARQSLAGLALEDFLLRFGLDEAQRGVVAAALSGCQPFRNVPLCRLDPDSGRLRHFLLSGCPSWDAAGAFAGYRGIGVEVAGDIATRGVQECGERGDAALSLFRKVMDAAHEAVSILSPAGHVLYANPAYARLFGLPLAAAVGSHYRSYFPASSQSVLDRTVGLALLRGESWEGVVEAVDVSGRTFPLWQRAGVLRDSCGRVQYFFAFMHDHTEQQEFEDQLFDAKEAAEEAALAKTRFLAAASHDLRQPMQALAMFVAVLAGRSMPPDQSTLVERIQDSVTALDGLLNGLLDVSKLEAGLVEPHVAPFPLAAMMGRLAAEFAPLCREQGLTLKVVPTRAVVHSDPTLLERILRNLLSNAVRYTRSGRILFGCRRRGSSLGIHVWDTGIGIPEAEIRNIFREFHQVGNQGRDRRQGLGLGLAIAQRLTNLLGHGLAVRSQEGHGSDFSVSVPLVRQPAAASQPMQLQLGLARRGTSVLVIDDEPDVRESLEMLLESWGHMVLAAASADDALAKLSKWGRSPDLVIADYRLQNGNTGGEAIAQIEQSLKPQARLPAIIVTGDTAPERLQQAQALGYGLLHKPVRADALRRAMDEALARGIRAHRRAARAKGGAMKP
jgi:PAS domain S-box